MKLHLIEADAGDGLWGKFAVGRPEPEEWAVTSEVDVGRPLIASRGHSYTDVWVWDLQTCEGAIFSPGGNAVADLMKHRIHVCPKFEGFLTWLYLQDLTDLSKLPRVVRIPGATGSYRRPGPSQQRKEVA